MATKRTPLPIPARTAGRLRDTDALITELVPGREPAGRAESPAASAGARTAAPAPIVGPLAVEVELPPLPRPEVPADELRLRIDDVAVDPARLQVVGAPSVDVTAALAGLGYDARSRSGRWGRRRPLRPAAPESAATLTAERLVAPGPRVRSAPTGGWNRFVWAASLHRLHLGDSARVRLRSAEEDRIRRRLAGGTRFVPVLTRKGGVGKTTVTALLGMTLAAVRDDRVVAIDADPDRGTLAERVTGHASGSVRDVVSRADEIEEFSDLAGFVSRDSTRLDVLASDVDPTLAEAFDDEGYAVVSDLASRFYSIVLTDCGTGIVHPVMGATLARADSVVIVSGGSVEEARLASETLTWLEVNGYGALADNAVVAVNTAGYGSNVVDVDEIEAHFATRVREVVRIPYDPQLAAGAVVQYDDLSSHAKDAGRALAATVVDGLPA